MSDWRPIETAPKDGTRIILAVNSYVTVGRWTPKFAAVYGDSSEGWYDDILDRRIDGPTEWMPLPTPSTKLYLRQSGTMDDETRRHT